MQLDLVARLQNLAAIYLDSIIDKSVRRPRILHIKISANRRISGPSRPIGRRVLMHCRLQACLCCPPNLSYHLTTTRCASCFPNMRSERVIEGTFPRSMVTVSTIKATPFCTNPHHMQSQAPLSSASRLEQTFGPTKKSVKRKVKSGCLTCK
jgi:hypothetical protein